MISLTSVNHAGRASVGVVVLNLGCKVNRIESDDMEALIQGAGYKLVDAERAQIAVINTCCVTGEAQAKTRKSVRRTLERANINTVLATGCAANLFADELLDISELVHVFRDKNGVVDALDDTIGLTYTIDGESYNLDTPNLRVGIKVQDGCDNRCTYCIVWKARGSCKSVDSDLVVERVNQAVKSHVYEVVLSGINLGRYTDSKCEDLAGLINRIINETNIPRIRLSSIESVDISDELLKLLASPRICSHIHLAIQSGSNTVLKRMDRKYSVEEYCSLIERARQFVPGLSVSTDIIVGFPGETDKEFNETLSVCQKIGYSKIHVFKFSKRPGTPASEMDNQIEAGLISSRSSMLRNLGRELRVADAQKRVGLSEDLLIEVINDEGVAVCTSEAYHRVKVAQCFGCKPGDVINASFESVGPDGVITGILQ